MLWALTRVMVTKPSSIGWRSAYYQVCLVQCLQIVLFQAAAYHNHRVSVTGKDEVHHQSGYTSVAVLEGVDADVAVMEECGQLHRRQLALLLGLVVPVHKVGHQRRCLFGRCVVESVAIAGDDTVGTCLVRSGMDGIAGLHTSRQVAPDGVVLTQQRAVQGTDEMLRQGLLFLARLHQHHL